VKPPVGPPSARSCVSRFPYTDVAGSATEASSKPGQKTYPESGAWMHDPSASPSAREPWVRDPAAVVIGPRTPRRDVPSPSVLGHIEVCVGHSVHVRGRRADGNPDPPAVRRVNPLALRIRIDPLRGWWGRLLSRRWRRWGARLCLRGDGRWGRRCRPSCRARRDRRWRRNRLCLRSWQRRDRRWWGRLRQLDLRAAARKKERREQPGSQSVSVPGPLRNHRLSF
jgi:hypothetical protein